MAWLVVWRGVCRRESTNTRSHGWRLECVDTACLWLCAHSDSAKNDRCCSSNTLPLPSTHTHDVTRHCTSHHPLPFMYTTGT